MQFKNHITQKRIIDIISMLFIVLFVYASISKLLEFKDFQTQLGQSPVLGAFAMIISYSVIGMELITALLLALEKTRILGLYIAFTLMVMFTSYIVIILNFTSFTPCSCGGVLEALGWTEHLIFNAAFITLALWALYVARKASYKQVTRRSLSLACIGFACVFGLFFSSDQEIKRNNAFQRKYSPHGLEELGSIPLESNSFYIAGIDDSMIYLGNYYAPLYLKAIDIYSKTSKDIKIEIENYELPYKRVRIEVNPPYFFIGDGTIPILFRGKISDWKAKTFSHGDAHFYQFAAIDSTSIVLSTTSSKTKMNVLGILQNDQDKTTFNLNSKILKKQSSGTFDTDGILLWNNQHQYMLYVYYYRNQFEITNKQLQFQYTGKTIDTIKQAQINVDYYQKDAQYKIGKAIVVNRHASTYGN